MSISNVWYERLNIQIYGHKNNKGIHEARITGLRHAVGQYVLFLDQDDTIMPNWLATQLATIGDADIALGNGIYTLNEARVKRSVIYRDVVCAYLAWSLWVSVSHGSKIISPGQVLIRRSSIPPEYSTCLMQRNGCDDALLWVIMMSRGARMRYNSQRIYVHKATGQNVSSSREGMLSSGFELVDIMQKHHFLPGLYQIILARHTQVLGLDGFIRKLPYMDIVLQNAFVKGIYGVSKAAYMLRHCKKLR